jgi:hypothetical protein
MKLVLSRYALAGILMLASMLAFSQQRMDEETVTMR